MCYTSRSILLFCVCLLKFNHQISKLTGTRVNAHTRKQTDVKRFAFLLFCFRFLLKHPASERVPKNWSVGVRVGSAGGKVPRIIYSFYVFTNCLDVFLMARGVGSLSFCQKPVGVRGSEEASRQIFSSFDATGLDFRAPTSGCLVELS